MSPDLGDMIQQNQNFPLHKDKDKDLLKDLVVIMMVDTTAILIREEVVMDTIGPLLDMAEEIMVEAEGVEVEMEEMVAEEMEAIIKVVVVAVGMIAIVIVILIGTAENLQEEEEDMAEEEVVEEEEVEDMIDLPPTMIEE